jgi:hypothetical protein
MAEITDCDFAISAQDLFVVVGYWVTWSQSDAFNGRTDIGQVREVRSVGVKARRMRLFRK